VTLNENYRNSSFKCHKGSPYIPSFLQNDQQYNFGVPIIQHIVCARSSLAIQCAFNEKIHIHSGYYGIQPNTMTSCTLNKIPKVNRILILTNI
jgi:hypothetical protein